MDIGKEAFLTRAVRAFGEAKALLIEYATGTGKTRAALECARGARSLAIIVAEKNHVDKVWKAEMDKWDIHFEEVHFMHASHIKPIAVDIVIWDEAHMITEKRAEAYRKIAKDKAVFLSASMRQERMMLLMEVEPDIKVVSATLKDAAKAGAIHMPIIYPVAIDTLDVPGTYAVRIARTYRVWKTVNTWDKSMGDKPVMVKGPFLPVADALDRAIQYFSVVRKNGDMAKILGTKRKLMYTKAKCAFLRDHLPQVLATRAGKSIIWGSDKSNFGTLFQGKLKFTDYAFHSKLPAAVKRRNMRAFMEGDLPFLYVVNLMVTGITPPPTCNAFLVINATYSSTVRLVQQIGRATRRAGNMVFAFYLKNMKKEEEWIAKLSKLAHCHEPITVQEAVSLLAQGDDGA
ncbi:MAG: hypothetical protein D6746_11170 [Bacteroidetes bacterium]|nr:MAG: hypothetical protein D6746_11170 [Bacteroidota bacterium]